MQVGRVKHVDVQLESVTWALRSPFLERVKSPIAGAKGELCAAKCHL